MGAWQINREINDVFKKFYINLYTSENTATDKEIMSFLTTGGLRFTYYFTGDT